MSPLEELISSEIRSRGPMSVARFMELALYHPEHGYYTAGAQRSGWRGHFLTSPEIDPAFGELWARGFEQVWEMCGRPQQFEIVEIGPGEGGFATAVLEAAEGEFAAALSYLLVERSEALRQRQAVLLADYERVAWSESFAGVAAGAGCVFANEVLDNLPVHVVEGRAGDTMEVLVDTGRDGLELTLAPAGMEVQLWLQRVGIEVPEGQRVEVGLAADALVTAAARAIERGAVVLCDYGLHADQAGTRPSGTLACYSETGIDDEWLERPGRKDITSHANWTAVGDALRLEGLDPFAVVSQRTILKRLGLDALHTELRTASGRGGAQGLRALSRRQALGVLGDPGGLGGLGVLTALKAIDPAPFLTEG